jgi:GT2 family glycosyltransferase
MPCCDTGLALTLRSHVMPKSMDHCADTLVRQQDAPRVTVIIPHYNDPERLDLCLAALNRQDFTRDHFTIIVADNGSPTGEAALTERIAGRARLVIAGERGAGPARNAGVSASGTPILAFTDADCIPHPSWLSAGVAALDRYQLVGGQMTVLVDHDGPKNPTEAFECVFAFDNATYVRDKGFTVTANLFTTRGVFDAVGGFGAGMSEDLDWCHRATAQGFRLGYAADAIVGHPAREDWSALVHKWRRINAETWALKPPTLAHKFGWLVRSWLLPFSIIAHAPRIWASPSLTSSTDRIAALRGLVRLRLWRVVDAHRLAFGWRR